MLTSTWWIVTMTIPQFVTICSLACFLPAGWTTKNQHQFHTVLIKRYPRESLMSRAWRVAWFLPRLEWRQILTCFTTPFLNFTGAWGALIVLAVRCSFVNWQRLMISGCDSSCRRSYSVELEILRGACINRVAELRSKLTCWLYAVHDRREALHARTLSTYR